MDRKKFLRNALLGAGAVATGTAAAAIVHNNIDELQPIDPNKQVGFNHQPVPETKMTNNSVIHKAETRGSADLGWLKSRHTFSFANYYNPDRMNFGALRVLNDDFVIAGKGFGTHPHDNMEIITIPLEGVIEHKDSMGNSGTITSGEVQVMSAGTGIYHSEFNHKSDKDLRFLQIWVFPDKASVTPRYDQFKIPVSEKNKLQQILSPDMHDDGVWIHQQAWFNLGTFDKGKLFNYNIHKPDTHGVYAFVISGSVKINGQELATRDGYGIWNIDKLDMETTSETRLLLMEVPMNIG